MVNRLYDVTADYDHLSADAKNNSGIGSGHPVEAMKYKQSNTKGMMWLPSQSRDHRCSAYTDCHAPLLNTPEKLPITDVRRSLALLRDKADTYQLHPDKIGVMGFSAGSHLLLLQVYGQVKDEKANFSG